MNSYLVGSSRLKPCLHVGITAKARKYLIMGNRLASVSYHCHFLSVGRVSAYRFIYRTAIIFKVADNYRVVHSVRLTLLYLGSKGEVKYLVPLVKMVVASLIIYSDIPTPKVVIARPVIF